MFKKSNRNFRVKKAELDSDDNTENKDTIDDEAQSARYLEQTKTPILKQDSSSQPETHYSKPSTVKTAILSFNDNLEDTEESSATEFKVKKSKESRRIAKELKKSKKDKEKHSKLHSDIKIEHEEIEFTEVIRVKPLEVQTNREKSSKYLFNKYQINDSKSEDEFTNYQHETRSEDELIDGHEGEEAETEKLKRLREEFEILNGEDLYPVENETDEKKRSMKLMLKSGIIPDAVIIHEARKKREMARQGDYIPIGGSKTLKNQISKSRTVREDDENDLSEDEHGSHDPSNRVSLNFKEKAFKERQITRNNFLAYEQGSDDDRDVEPNSDLDVEEDEEDIWEREQIKKGVLLSQASTANIDLKNIKHTKLMEKLFGTNLEPQPMEIESTYKTMNLDKLNNLTQVTFSSIKDSLKKSMASLEDTYRSHTNEFNMTTQNFNANKTDLENLKNSKPLLDKQYVYYQEMKAFLTDFIDCYNEKISEIDKAEQKWLTLMKQRSDRVAARRQEDMRDQNFECSTSMSSLVPKKPLDPSHQRRKSDRESRRSIRGLSRSEKKSVILNEVELIDLNEGFSTDDEENQADEKIFRQKRDDILAQLHQDIFTDVIEDFYKLDLIKQRFENWKKLNPFNYKNAYVSLSLPKLFSPIVRVELVDWNPVVTSDASYLEKTKWFNDLISFNKDDLQESNMTGKLDDDFLLIPHIIEKIVLNKLITIAESVYDPVSSKQTINFSNLVSKLINDYPTLNSQSLNTKKLIETLIARFKKSFDQDVFVPLYSKQTIAQKMNDSSRFFYRQFWSCVKLFANVLKWRGILSDSVIKELALDCLLNRYLMIGLQSMEATIQTVYKIEYILKKLPSDWLETNIASTNTMSLPQLANILRLLRRIADQINQDEFKSNKIDSKEFKDQIQYIRKLFLSLGATDQAVSLSNAYEL